MVEDHWCVEHMKEHATKRIARKESLSEASGDRKCLCYCKFSIFYCRASLKPLSCVLFLHLHQAQNHIIPLLGDLSEIQVVNPLEHTVVDFLKILI